ncbi:MAG: XylR family transcriptional regulator [Pirellulaceae bacterium]|nr:XylR family transcriptional regulator [Pirellulaceae bacterium]
MNQMKHVALLIETSREYGRGLLRGVTRFHREHGNWSIYFKPQGLRDRAPTWLSEWKGDGILARIDSCHTADSVLKTGLPVIDLRGVLPDLGVPEIGIDNRALAKLVLQHLLDRGLRNFAFCGDRPGRNRWSDQRREMFRQAVESAGFRCHEFSNRRRMPSWEYEQEQITQWVKQLPQPVGVMASNDDLGQQVLDACLRADVHVPDEVALIGVDNDPYLCNLTLPPMTSVDVNSERIGYEAAKLLDRLMLGCKPPKLPVYLEPAQVVMRQSTDTIAVDDLEVATVVRFIRDHACEGITIEDAFAKVLVSRSTLTRRFKALLQRTPMAELTRVRLQKARQLLLETDLGIAQVAARSGFSEAKYLITVFHQTFGVTPGAFRKTSA